MNPILEHHYPDKTVLARRQAAGLLPLDSATDAFVAYLHEEMRQCFLNGHDHAALVTACALIDFSLKDAIEFDNFIQNDCVFDGVKWDAIDKLSFGNVITMAKQKSVITKEEWEQLDWLRKHIRNFYMHGQTPDWIKDESEKIVVGKFATGHVEEQTVNVRDNIVLQRWIRIVADRNVCDRIVRLVDNFVREFNLRAIAALDEWKRTNPSKPSIAQVEQVLQNVEALGLKPNLVIASEWPIEMTESSE